jgi:protein ImuB
MAPLEKPRAWPELTPSAEPARRTPRLRPAGGGGRERNDRSARHPDTSRELWLAIYLPQVMLEALKGGQPSFPEGRGSSFVVVDQERGGKVVCACNDAATADGIAAGMALNSALALQPGLTVRDRDPRRERELLEKIAEWAVHYTSRISLEPPDAVLLEVRGSLRLFGGSRRLLSELRGELDAAGLTPRLALTPTPLASLWFARAGEERTIGRREDLAARVTPLPLACTSWPERDLRSLATMGVRTVGDCLRLPRDGFARRFEPGKLEMLDRALGRRPDPRTTFLPRERYSARRDLEPEVTEAAQLDAAAAPLLAGLCAFLRQRQRGVQGFELRLVHRDASPTRLRFRFAEPVADLARIMRLLRERFSRLVLSAPVRSLRLLSGSLLAPRAESHELFAADRRRAGSGVPQLVERLQARLGADAVHGLCLIPEHRPERRMGTVPISEAETVSPSTGAETGTVPRPLWLLAEPQALEGLEQPQFEGDLTLEEGPERIESGWWDGRDVTRDYYVARNPAGARLWVFRERRPPRRWFLHGIFG